MQYDYLVEASLEENTLTTRQRFILVVLCYNQKMDADSCLVYYISKEELSKKVQCSLADLKIDLKTLQDLKYLRVDKDSMKSLGVLAFNNGAHFDSNEEADIDDLF